MLSRLFYNPTLTARLISPPTVHTLPRAAHPWSDAKFWWWWQTLGTELTKAGATPTPIAAFQHAWGAARQQVVQRLRAKVRESSPLVLTLWVCFVCRVRTRPILRLVWRTDLSRRRVMWLWGRARFLQSFGGTAQLEGVDWRVQLHGVKGAPAVASAAEPTAVLELDVTQQGQVRLRCQTPLPSLPPRHKGAVQGDSVRAAATDLLSLGLCWCGGEAEERERGACHPIFHPQFLSHFLSLPCQSSP